MYVQHGADGGGGRVLPRVEVALGVDCIGHQTFFLSEAILLFFCLLGKGALTL